MGTIHAGLSSADALHPLDELHKTYPTPPPPRIDARHPSNDFKELKAYNKSMGWPSGILHTSFGMPTGHDSDVHLHPEKQYNHGLSTQSKGTKPNQATRSPSKNLTKTWRPLSKRSVSYSKAFSLKPTGRMSLTLTGLLPRPAKIRYTSQNDNVSYHGRSSAVSLSTTTRMEERTGRIGA